LLLTAAIAAPVAHAEASFEVVVEQGENALAHGRLDGAERFLAEALVLAEATGRESPEQARVHLDLARLRRAQGDPKRAGHELGLARFAARSAHGEDSLAMAEVEIERTLQYQLTGLYDEAVTAAQEALRIRRLHLPLQAPLVRETLHFRAWSHHLAFQYPRAVAAFEETFEVMSEEPVSSVQDRVIVLNRLAWIFERAGLLDRAAESKDHARALVAAGRAGRGTSDRLFQVGLDGLSPPSEEHLEKLAAMKAFAREWARERHFHPEHFSFDYHQLVTLRRFDRETPPHRVRFMLERDLMGEFLAFAPTSPRVTSRHRYGMPFLSRVPRQVLRTSEGAHGFHRVLLHAVDFEVPPGTAVLAAREGRVVRVVHGFRPGEEKSLKPEDDLRHGLKVNRVIILHDDDTYATYLPLMPELEVAEGDRVVRGQQIGRTTRVDDRRTAMVHFDVRRNNRSAGSGGVVTAEPVRARFAAVGDRDGIPLAERYYGGESVPASPAPTAD
jgi:murein DD-endopeptidase MepM/ murein hydrolase activator NlpD